MMLLSSYDFPNSILKLQKVYTLYQTNYVKLATLMFKKSVISLLFISYIYIYIILNCFHVYSVLFEM